MTTMFWIWLAAVVAFLILELMTPTLIFGCFTVGALSSAIYSYFSPESYYWQIGLFIGISVILLPLTRSLAGRITKPSPQKSNVDALIGKTALVTRAIDPDRGGQVRFEGETWVAFAREPIAADTKVRITSVTGTKLHVEKMQD